VAQSLARTPSSHNPNCGNHLSFPLGGACQRASVPRDTGLCPPAPFTPSSMPACQRAKGHGPVPSSTFHTLFHARQCLRVAAGRLSNPFTGRQDRLQRHLNLLTVLHSGFQIQFDYFAMDDTLQHGRGPCHLATHSDPNSQLVLPLKRPHHRKGWTRCILTIAVA
jgi:hypothetical protein